MTLRPPGRRVPLGEQGKEVMDEKRYTLIRDNASHWFVCPADKVDEAHAYFDAVGKYWRSGGEPVEEPREPDYLQSVGGAPTLVSFTDPVIR